MRALVTGGASSGKSAFAEDLACALGGDLVYLATMRPFGREGARRVERHRLQRAGKGFDTVECFGSLEDALATGRLDGACVLLEDLGNLVANELFGEDGRSGPLGVQTALTGLDELARRAAHLVVVGNEVGCDGAFYSEETRRYQEEIGRVACKVAALSDTVIECIAGIPELVKAPATCMSTAGAARARALESQGAEGISGAPAPVKMPANRVLTIEMARSHTCEPLGAECITDVPVQTNVSTACVPTAKAVRARAFGAQGAECVTRIPELVKAPATRVSAVEAARARTCESQGGRS